jgi:hypothetical protein
MICENACGRWMTTGKQVILFQVPTGYEMGRPQSRSGHSCGEEKECLTLLGIEYRPSLDGQFTYI